MTPTAGHLDALSSSSSHSRPSTITTMALPPATLQPDPSFPLTVPYLPARIPLSPPPYRNVFLQAISTSSSPAVSPTAIPPTSRPAHCPLATPFFPGTPSTKSLTATANPQGLYERTGRCSKCVCQPRPLNETGANAVFPWGTVSWTASNRAEKKTSLVYSAESYLSYTSISASSSKGQPNAPD
jgi:hypothetical protein